jgi:integrase
MGRSPFIGVHVYDFDTKKRARPDKPSPWVVRWRVAGAKTLGSKSFKHLGDAKKFHRELHNAADRGELFDPETRLPVSMLAPTATTSVAQLVFMHYQENINRWLPRSRASNAEVFASLLLVAVRRNPTALPASRSTKLTDEQQMRSDIYDWLLTDTSSKSAKPMPKWLQKNTVPLQALTEDMCVGLNERLNTRLDGTPKAQSTQNRIRTNINALFKFAVKKNLIIRNPWPEVKRLTQSEQATKKEPPEVVERKLPKTTHIAEALDELTTPSSRPGAVARRVLIAIMAYAGLRPSEAVALRIEDCVELPAQGWGRIYVVQSNKATFDKRWMKSTPSVGLTKTGTIRTLAIPQELVAIIRDHIGDRTEGLVAPDERGGMMHTGNLARAWRKVRQSPDWRPYDLRAARASLHVNAGRPRSEVAREMGHSPAVLDEFYLGVSDDDVNTGLARVEERLSIARPPAKKAAAKRVPRKAAAKKAAASKRAQPTSKRPPK